MKKNLRLLTIIVSALMGASLLAGCAKSSTGSDGSSKGDLTIGAVLPLTGSIASYGISSKEALMVLEDQVNKDGGVLGKNIKFEYQDDQGDPAKSSNALQKLISDKVVGVVGTVTSSGCLAMGPIATSKKIPMITGTATNATVTTVGGDYVFRSCYLDPFQGKTVANFAATDLSAKKAAILYNVGSDYSKGLADSFETSFKSAGGTVTSKLTYNDKDTDFNAQLTKIKDQKPDVIFLPEYYNEVGLIAKQAKSLGITATLLGGDGWDSPDLVKVGGDAINGGYFCNHYSPDDKSAEVQAFLKAYGAKFNGKTPDALAVLSYDAGKLLLDAIKKANSTDGTKIKDALKGIDDKVVSGEITFDKDRNSIKGAVIIKIDGGKQILAKKISAN